MSDQNDPDSSGGRKLSDPVYEMFWDCEYCGSSKLLGKTHRHCPACGAAQDPDARYFPSEEEKIAVQDHIYFGADLLCASCERANSAKAKFCGGCGAPLDGSEEAAAVKTPEHNPQKRTPPPKKTVNAKHYFGGTVLLILSLIGYNSLVTGKTKLTVVGHRWERTRELRSTGQGRNPQWPEMAYNKCVSIHTGCERPGARTERFILELRTKTAEQTSCTVPERRWRQLDVGTRLTAKTG